MVTVSNVGQASVEDVSVEGVVAVRDVSNTTFTLDGSDFGGTQTVDGASEAVFQGRSVTIAAGMTASYEVVLSVEGDEIDTRSESVVDCPA